MKYTFHPEAKFELNQAVDFYEGLQRKLGLEFLLTKKNPAEPQKTRKAGFLKGQIEMSADFDKPLEDFKEYMQY